MNHNLTLHRILKAPRHLIYECWTTPEHMTHWFMPKPHKLTDIELDLRPGGRFNSTMIIDGQTMPSKGIILDAVPGIKFVFSDLMTENFQPVASPELGYTATIELKDHPFYLACQYHPEFQSKPNQPHPLFRGFVTACLAQGG